MGGESERDLGGVAGGEEGDQALLDRMIKCNREIPCIQGYLERCSPWKY